MKKEKGIYKDEKTNTYFVSTTFTTADRHQIRKTKRGFKTIEEALMWKEANKKNYSNISYQLCFELHTNTEEIVYKYLMNRKINMKLSSYSIIENYIKNHFIKYFNDCNINLLNPNDINEYYINIANINLKPKTINMIISTVLVMINWLDDMQLIIPFVARKFKQILKPINANVSPKNDYLNKNEIIKLLNSFNDDEFNEMVMFEIFCYGGLRKSELRALTYDDINFRSNTIVINKQLQAININGKIENRLVLYTKTNTNRIIKMPKKVIEDIKVLKKEGFLFNFSANKINKILTEHLKIAGIKIVKVHDLRHSYCTMLYDNGADSKFVQMQMGHKSDRTSKDIYEHLTKKMEDRGNDIIKKLC